MSIDDPLRASLVSQSGGPIRFGTWTLVTELGRGAYGVVYKARRRESNQDVALKVIRALGPIDPRELARFDRESRMLAKVDHPGIVRVLDSGVTGGLPWVALELIDGEPLKGLPLELEAMVETFARIARAVGAAHRAHIVHRDLKPMNVLVERATGVPKLLDFGMAFDARLDALRLTRTGEIQGTPAYMAPEVLRGEARPDDPRRDVYALGVMLHERLLGEHPFAKPGLAATGVLDLVLRGAPSLVGRRGVDRDLARICERACALDPAKRPPDGDAIALELETWLARRRAGVAAPRSPARRVLGGVVALLLVLGVAALGALTRTKAPPAAPSPTAPPVSPPRPAPPPPPPPVAPVAALRAPVEELEAIEEGLWPGLRRGGSEVRESVARGAALAERFPDDPRAAFFAVVARASDPGMEFEVRRGLVRLLRVRPALPWRDLVFLGNYFRTVGFDRAACCVGEEVYPVDEERPIPLANFQMHFHLLADDPVRDPLRAERLATLLLARKTDADANEYPERFLLHLAQGDAALGQGDAERAADRFETAAREMGGPQARALAQHAVDVRRGHVGPESMGGHFVASIEPTDFLQAVAQHENASDLPDAQQQRAAKTLARIAETEARAGRPEHAALAYVRAARIYRRGGHGSQARDLLYVAAALTLPAIDTRSLVKRAFAHTLLVVDGAAAAEDAERLALDAASAAPGDFDPRTPCEVADAWALVARARLERHDEAGAREALAKARALAPRDTRALEEVEAKLAR